MNRCDIVLGLYSVIIASVYTNKILFKLKVAFMLYVLIIDLTALIKINL